MSQVVATPVINPPYKEVWLYSCEKTMVTISCATEGATIHFTTNGNEPTVYSETYTGHFFVDTDKWYVVKAKAFKDGQESAVARAEYEVRLASPMFDPPLNSSGFVLDNSNPCFALSVRGQPGYTPETPYLVSVTTDGRDPPSAEAVLSKNLILTQNTTVKARCFADINFGSMVGSLPAGDTITQQYKFKPAAPFILDPYTTSNPPPTCNFVGQTNVRLECTTPGVTIYYTLDGTDPQTSSTRRSQTTFALAETRVVKARAFKANLEYSDLATRTFTLKPLTRPPLDINKALFQKDLSRSR